MVSNPHQNLSPFQSLRTKRHGTVSCRSLQTSFENSCDQGNRRATTLELFLMPLFDHHIGLPIFVFKNSEAVNHGTINQPLQLLAGCDMTLHFTHNAIRTMTTSPVYTRLSSRIRTKFEMPLLAFGDTVKQCIVVLGFPHSACMGHPPAQRYV